MNFAVMRTKLRRKLGNPSIQDVTEEELNDALNCSNKDLSTNYSHHKSRKLCSFPTIAGQADYALPIGIAAVRKVWDDTNKKRMIKSGMTFLADNLSSTDAKPTNYVRIRDFLRLVPTPDGVYTIWVFYTYVIPEMVSDTDEPVINELWHPGIVQLAKWYYYDDHGDQVKAAAAWSSWLAWMSNKKSEIDEETVDIDSGVSVPSLATGVTRLNFDESS